MLTTSLLAMFCLCLPAKAEEPKWYINGVEQTENEVTITYDNYADIPLWMEISTDATECMVDYFGILQQNAMKVPSYIIREVTINRRQDPPITFTFKFEELATPVEVEGVLCYYKLSGSWSGIPWVKNKPAASSLVAESSDKSHEHVFTYRTIVEVTSERDGLEGEYCICGATRDTVVIPAAIEYYKSLYAQIDNVQSGQNVVLDCGLNHTFSKYIMKKIASKVANGVSYKINYEYEHKQYSIEIPAYTDVDVELDWYGPLKMWQLYGK